MITRLKKCCKAWGAGVIIMGFPLVFLYPEFSVEREFWRIPIVLFFVYFPVLLFFEFFIQAYLRFSKVGRILILILLFILSEIEIYYLPVSITQLSFYGGWFSIIVLFLFVLIAGFIVSIIMTPRKNIVIIQKEV